jgi:RNA polymerase sigma factor (TIGR02999 family)
MSDVTQILSRLDAGDPSASGELLPLIYEELRKLAAARFAQEKPGQTLQATALVHEAYVRLVGSGGSDRWDSRGHFFAAAAEAMRRILIEQARAKNAVKRGGMQVRANFDDVPEPAAAATGDVIDILALDEALSKLAIEAPAKAELVKLRYFAGLSLDEAAGVLNISEATAKRYWAFARAWLFQALAPLD